MNVRSSGNAVYWRGHAVSFFFVHNVVQDVHFPFRRTNKNLYTFVYK